MFRRASVNFAIYSLILDLLLTFGALRFAVLLRPRITTLPGMVNFQLNFEPILYGILLVIWFITFLSFSIYDPKKRYRVTDEIQQLVLAISFASLVYAGFLYFGFREVSRYLFAFFVIIDLILLIGWRLVFRILHRMYGRQSIDRRALIVGADSAGHQVFETLSQFSDSGLEVVGYIGDRSAEADERYSLSPIGNIEDVPFLVRKLEIDDVIIALPRNAYEKLNKLVHKLHELPVSVRIVPDYFSLALFRATADEFAGVPMINLRAPALNEVQRLTKRLTDLIISTSLLILVSPVMFITAIFVKLDSDGPVFYKQQRIGENGHPFGMFKFRSMEVDADLKRSKVFKRDEDGNLIHKSENDPRVTKVGKFIRRMSIDELPQLINVFKGEMSLVGPRPEMPWVIQNYEPWQLKRLSVPQGITGWWQVNGRSDKPMHLHTEEDLYYIQNYTIWMDIYILLKTPWAILRGKGAY